MRAKGAFPSCALSFTAAVREGHFTAYHSRSENARTVDRARCTERAGARSPVLPREFALLPSARTCDKHHNTPSTRARAQRTKQHSATRICHHPESATITGEKALLQVAEGNLEQAREEGAIDPEVRSAKTDEKCKVSSKGGLLHRAKLP